MKEDLDLARLAASMQRSRLVLRKPREQRLLMTKEFVGAHWSEEGSAKIVPCNLLALYVDVVGRKLVSANPRAMLSTDDKTIKPVVAAEESWVNRQIVRIDLAKTLERVVTDALFSIGICKVGLASPADAALTGWNIRAGEPYACRVDLDDFVFDTHARDFSECSYIGHRYRVPLKAVRDSKVFSKGRKSLVATEDKLFNWEGDERISVIGRGYYGDMEEYEDMVDLWEVFLPRHRLIVTLRDDQLTGAMTESGKYEPHYGKALRIQRWLGPDSGPYHILSMGVVPGNAMPKAPLQDLYDLHLSINRMIRKLMNQADRQKEMAMASQGGTEDGSRVVEGNDGDMIRVDDPRNVNVVNFGGPNQNNFQLFAAFKDLFSWLAGNLDAMGGLSPQAKTLGQDELLQQGATANIASMQEKTVSLASSVIKALCWYWHNDPRKVMTTSYPLPGLQKKAILRHVHPYGSSAGLARNHSFEEMDISVDPYSLQYVTPQQRVQMLNQIVSQILGPLMPLLQQQGIMFNADEYLQKLAKYMNLPDLPDIVTLQEPPTQESQGGVATQGPAPANTTRNYVRRSVGGATAAGADLERGNQMTAPQQPSLNGASR